MSDQPAEASPATSPRPPTVDVGGGQAPELLVRDLMTTRVFSLTEGQSITLAESAMQSMHVRHIPIVGKNRSLVGIVTHRDLLRAKLSELTPLSSDERSSHELKVPVSKVMQRNVWSVAPNTPAVSAARMLKDHRFGCLPVVQNHQLVGIVTEADFLRLVTDSLELVPKPEPVTMAAVMTPAPITLRSDQSIAEARQLMTREGIRHLPLVDDGGAPVGIVSDRDLRTAAAIVGGTQKADGLAVGLLGSEPPYTVAGDAALGPVLLDMAAQKRGSALVVKDGRLVGIVTTHDACQMLAERLDARRPEPPPFR